MKIDLKYAALHHTHTNTHTHTLYLSTHTHRHALSHFNALSHTPFFNIFPRYIKVKVEHYLLFMFSPPKIS